MRKAQYISLAILLLSLTACSSSVEESNQTQFPESEASQERLDMEGSNEKESGKEESDNKESDKEETDDIRGTEDVKETDAAEGIKNTEAMEELPDIQPGKPQQRKVRNWR